MQRKKIFILLPDGIGLRNFAYTNFQKVGFQKGFDIFFWNNTPFDITSLGFKEIKINYAKSHPLTDLYKIAQSHIELNQNIKKSKNTIYNSYRFPLSKKSLKGFLKNIIVKGLILFNNSEKGLVRIREKIALHESKTKYYHDCLDTLAREKPDFVFCTNQRIMLAVAPILAAQKLEIPTATFIFSWDNLPKASKIIETDFYFVWSNFMKNQLLYYYPHVAENQIKITGTTQFEPHLDKDLLLSKGEFFKRFDLDVNVKYICFSGDDITTSPNDPTYLNDLANAILKLNNSGYNLGIIFRKCPVDFSNRFDEVLKKHNSIIKSINPKWEKIADSWNAILPTKEDLILQMNTIYHSECVINLGSSMVFDFIAFNKPCGYINYNVVNTNYPDWSVEKIYEFIHFKSMPNHDTVFWINDPNKIDQTIIEMLSSNNETVLVNAKKWFEKINQHPPELVSERIWNAIEETINI